MMRLPKFRSHLRFCLASFTTGHRAILVPAPYLEYVALFACACTGKRKSAEQQVEYLHTVGTRPGRAEVREIPIMYTVFQTQTGLEGAVSSYHRETHICAQQVLKSKYERSRGKIVVTFHMHTKLR